VSAEPGLAFGSVAQAYELGRPGWPEELLDRVPVPAGSYVLDLAAGTGKLTRLLATRHRVVSVEPDDEMRALIPGGAALPGSAEAIPLPDGAVDAVFVAEAFHWFDGAKALAEIERVLRPRGVLVLCFNFWDEIRPDLPAEANRFLDGLAERFGPSGGPRVASGDWQEPFAASGFEELRSGELRHTSPLDRERVIALFSSMSNLARQPAEVRSAFASELAALVPERPRTLELRCAFYWTRLP
jgi:SAM-dependent methyltransferase